MFFPILSQSTLSSFPCNIFLLIPPGLECQFDGTEESIGNFWKEERGKSKDFDVGFLNSLSIFHALFQISCQFISLNDKDISDKQVMNLICPPVPFLALISNYSDFFNVAFCYTYTIACRRKSSLQYLFMRGVKNYTFIKMGRLTERGGRGGGGGGLIASFSPTIVLTLFPVKTCLKIISLFQ